MRSGERHCGIPLPQVLEVFRPLPVEALGDTPPFVLGLARVRSRLLPVVDLRLLLGDPAVDGGGRYVSLRVEDRRMALAVDQVLGLRAVPSGALEDMPPLLAAGSPAVEALATLDQGLLLLLRSARLVPPGAPL